MVRVAEAAYTGRRDGHNDRVLLKSFSLSFFLTFFQGGNRGFGGLRSRAGGGCRPSCCRGVMYGPGPCERGQEVVGKGVMVRTGTGWPGGTLAEVARFCGVRGLSLVEPAGDILVLRC